MRDRTQHPVPALSPRHDWLVWQIADSAFPAGSFAHSSGLETAWQCGEVDGLDGLTRFVHAALHQSAHGALPFVTAVHEAPSRLDAIDAIADAFLTNAIANRASRVQGRAFAASCARIWPSPALKAIESRIASLRGHYAPLAGAVMNALEIPLGVAQRLFVFQTARGVLAAAVRLGIIGSYQAQQLQWECGPLLDQLVEHCGALDDCHVAQTAPIMDILQSAHDRLYSRLFQS